MEKNTELSPEEIQKALKNKEYLEDEKRWRELLREAASLAKGDYMRWCQLDTLARRLEAVNNGIRAETDLGVFLEDLQNIFGEKT